MNPPEYFITTNVDIFFKYYENEKEINEVLNFFDFSGKKVLDIGCGTGRLTYEIAKLAKSVVGVDSAKDTIDKNKSQTRNLEFQVADAYNLPFPDHSFDVVFSSFCFSYLNDTKRALDEAFRVLNKKGSIVILDIVSDGEWTKIQDIIHKKLNSGVGPVKKLENYWSNLDSYVHQHKLKIKSKNLEIRFNFPNKEIACNVFYDCQKNEFKKPEVKRIIKDYFDRKSNCIVYDQERILELKL